MREQGCWGVTQRTILSTYGNLLQIRVVDPNSVAITNHHLHKGLAGLPVEFSRALNLDRAKTLLDHLPGTVPHLLLKSPLQGLQLGKEGLNSTHSIGPYQIRDEQQRYE